VKQKVYNFLPFKEARKFVVSLRFKNQFEWQQYAKVILEKKGMRNRIPISPQHYYKSKGWINWGDWLGTNNRLHNQKEILPYEEAKIIVHKLKCKSVKEWNAYCAELKAGNKYSRLLSRNPSVYYEGRGWKGWKDWLGPTFFTFLSYEDARKFIHKLSFKNIQEFRRYKKLLPSFIPRTPNTAYLRRHEWVSWGDFLGTVNISSGNKDHFSLKKLQQAIKEIARGR
jgi:hypothetical protein